VVGADVEAAGPPLTVRDAPLAFHAKPNRSHFAPSISRTSPRAYQPEDRDQRAESERFKPFAYDELCQRDRSVSI
jgi:hypothetical protein